MRPYQLIPARDSEWLNRDVIKFAEKTKQNLQEV